MAKVGKLRDSNGICLIMTSKKAILQENSSISTQLNEDSVNFDARANLVSPGAVPIEGFSDGIQPVDDEEVRIQVPPLPGSSPQPNNEIDLIEANLVEEDDPPTLVVAESIRTWPRKRLLVLVFGSILMVAVAVTLGVVLSSGTSRSPTESPITGDIPPSTDPAEPTAAPFSQSTAEPTSSQATSSPPTSASVQPSWSERLDIFLQELPAYSMDLISEEGSPQAKAVTFLEQQEPTETSQIGQRYALAILYYSTQGELWLQTENWLTKAPVCTWSGILCENDDVLIVQLDDNQLQGILPRELELLTSLESLVINDNGLTGGIPFGLLSLTSIEAGYNNFTGDLPTNMPKLKILIMEHNELWGGNLTSLQSFSNLETLRLTNTSLTGQLPTELGVLNRLQHVDLAWNAIDGSIPEELGSWDNLDILDLSHNSLNGPPVLDFWPEVREIYITSNLWTGVILEDTISDQLSWSRLEVLELSDNQLIGEIPSQLSRAPMLRILDVAFNPLSGEIPQSLGLLMHLERLNIQGTNVVGDIPPESCNRVVEGLLTIEITCNVNISCPCRCECSNE